MCAKRVILKNGNPGANLHNIDEHIILEGATLNWRSGLGLGSTRATPMRLQRFGPFRRDMEARTFFQSIAKKSRRLVHCINITNESTRRQLTRLSPFQALRRLVTESEPRRGGIGKVVVDLFGGLKSSNILVVALNGAWSYE